jgi:pimeloyl-ACP methyl ester carboxylesterase
MSCYDEHRAEELELRIPGLRLAARAWGPETGRRVLCLHGWLDSAASFDRLAPLLRGLRMVCLDLPGHGLSEHRHPTASYDFIYWIPDVLAAADALGWERFSLLGHSLGAMIASCVAGTAPERIERMALVDGLGPLTCEADQAPERLAAAIDERRAAEANPAAVYPDRGTVATKLQRALRGLTAEAARVLVGRGTREIPGGVTWRHDPRLRGKSMLRLTEAHVHAFLSRVTCPVLMIRPMGGWPANEELIRARLDRLQRGRLLKVEGGHHVHLTQPQNVAPHLQRFLTDEGEEEYEGESE